jgi:hypothetical protein
LALRGGEKVLEIGAGSGYAATVLSEIAANIYTRVPRPVGREGGRDASRRQRIGPRRNDGAASPISSRERITALCRLARLG